MEEDVCQSCAGSGQRIWSETRLWDHGKTAERSPDVSCAEKMAMNSLLGHRKMTKKGAAQDHNNMFATGPCGRHRRKSSAGGEMATASPGRYKKTGHMAEPGALVVNIRAWSRLLRGRDPSPASAGADSRLVRYRWELATPRSSRRCRQSPAEGWSGNWSVRPAQVKERRRRLKGASESQNARRRSFMFWCAVNTSAGMSSQSATRSSCVYVPRT